MDVYHYSGPVKRSNAYFETCLTNNWHGETTAPSEKKARSNLVYQFKKQFNLATNVKIILPGKIERG